MPRQRGVDRTMVLLDLVLTLVLFDGTVEGTFVVLQIGMSFNYTLLFLSGLGSQIGIITQGWNAERVAASARRCW